jgi:hypothetical protein
MEFNAETAKVWMEANASELLDEETLSLFDGNAPKYLLAEWYCTEHECEDWLDDANHPIWHLAAEVAKDWK